MKNSGTERKLLMIEKVHYYTVQSVQWGKKIHFVQNRKHFEVQSKILNEMGMAIESIFSNVENLFTIVHVITYLLPKIAVQLGTVRAPSITTLWQ